MPVDVLLTPLDDGISVDIHMLTSGSQRRPGPVKPHYDIPRAEWPEVLRRVDQGETYRHIASSYDVSYEAIRRVVRAARNEKR